MQSGIPFGHALKSGSQTCTTSIVFVAIMGLYACHCAVTLSVDAKNSMSFSTFCFRLNIEPL